MAIKNLASFNREVKKFSGTLLPKQFLVFQKKLAMEALRRIVMKTPVRTGYARGNWQTTIDTFGEGTIDQLDASGANAIMQGSSAIGGLRKIGQVVFITNNVVYILPLEHGHSQRAPQGMVAVTFEELSSMFGE